MSTSPTASSAPSAVVIADSISPTGHRLTTFEVKMHRFVLAEMNTHRAFSRNSASSRAIPISKQIDAVMNDPAMPLEWGVNQSGMQAAEVLSEADRKTAETTWLNARDMAVDHVKWLQELGPWNPDTKKPKGVHKQIANRLLEPFMWHTAIISSTDWVNFWKQRCTVFSPLAQPEMRGVADAMYEAYGLSTPRQVDDSTWHHGWHLPYIQEDELDLPLEQLKCISVARCARVSYLTHGGVRDVKEDLAFYVRLTTASPMHASPLEHVARPDVRLANGWENGDSNFTGWVQLRQDVERFRGIKSRG